MFGGTLGLMGALDNKNIIIVKISDTTLLQSEEKHRGYFFFFKHSRKLHNITKHKHIFLLELLNCSITIRRYILFISVNNSILINDFFTFAD